MTTTFVTPSITSSVSEGTPEDYATTTDVVSQETRLYIEGVQVMFDNMSIFQTYQGLPGCSFSMPPSPSLMEIVRYYQPKVHVFFKDKFQGGYRLLFWGHIVSAAYSRSRPGSGSASIQFRCAHKNEVLRQVTMDYSGGLGNQSVSSTDINPMQAAVKVNNFTSKDSIITALNGISGVASEDKDSLYLGNTRVDTADVTKLDEKFAELEKRFKGFPSVVMNLWNQIKRACYSDPTTNMAMAEMYIPLVEDGIALLNRMSGHHIVESLLEDSKVDYCNAQNVSSKILVPPTMRSAAISAVHGMLASSAVQEAFQFSNEFTDFLSILQSFYDSIGYDVCTLASPASIPVSTTALPMIGSSEPNMAVETIVKPQLPFYYSPVCNVVFPRMYDSISIQQEEYSVPTRITATHQSLPNQGSGISTNYRAPNSVREAVSVGKAKVSKLSTVQEGISDNSASEYVLSNTTGSSFNIPGRYEWGRGIIHRRIQIPWWLAALSKVYCDQGSAATETYPAKGTAEYESMLSMFASWAKRYGVTFYEDDGQLYKAPAPEKSTLNPFYAGADVAAHERILFSSVDYEYTKAIAGSRAGQITGIFNPYIIPGYPMDILDSSPNHPSFHAFCTSVTHNITARSISTDVGFAAAMSYAELSNYYFPPINPWLADALKMTTASTGTISKAAEVNAAGIPDSVPAASSTTTASGQIVTTTEVNKAGTTTSSTTASNSGSTKSSSQSSATPSVSSYGDFSKLNDVKDTILYNEPAWATASWFYISVLGVGAADPSQLYDFKKGQVVPQTRQLTQLTVGSSVSVPLSNGGEGNPYLTSMGNLAMVSRPIEGKNAISDKFGYEFIDIDLHSSETKTYTGSLVEYSLPKIGASWSMEPGDSLFLDYTNDADRIATFVDKVSSGKASSKKAIEKEKAAAEKASVKQGSGPTQTPAAVTK